MPALTMRMYTMAKNVVTPAMISMRMVEPAAVMPKNLSSMAAFLVLVTVNSSLVRYSLAAEAPRGNHRSIVSYFFPKDHAFSGLSVIFAAASIS